MEKILQEYNLLIFGLASIFFILLVVISFFYYKSLRKIKETKMTLIKVNENFSIINKILRHDLMNKFVSIEYATESFEKFNLPNIIYDIRKDAKDSIKLIKQMKEMELVPIEEQKNYQVVDVRTALKDLEEINKIPIDVFGDAKIVADNAIRSVFNNIIRNAIVHGGTEKIDVIITRKSNHCVIEFRDYGKGIPIGYEKKIFEEGFAMGDKANTGMGLYIVKNRIEKYGGSIVAYNNEDGGASFVLKMPYE